MYSYFKNDRLVKFKYLDRNLKHDGSNIKLHGSLIPFIFGITLWRIQGF